MRKSAPLRHDSWKPGYSKAWIRRSQAASLRNSKRTQHEVRKMRGLDSVKSWMGFMGWTDGGGPGSRKMEDGKIVAHHGDARWIEDVQDCCDKAEREAAREELLRRSEAASAL